MIPVRVSWHLFPIKLGARDPSSWLPRLLSEVISLSTIFMTQPRTPQILIIPRAILTPHPQAVLLRRRHQMPASKTPNDDYFLSNKPCDWNFADFSKVFVPDPTTRHRSMYYYKACLTAIANKRDPFQSSSEDEVQTANRLLRLLRAEKSKRTQKQRMVMEYR